jgi:hypothetical protein
MLVSVPLVGAGMAVYNFTTGRCVEVALPSSRRLHLRAVTLVRSEGT